MSNRLSLSVLIAGKDEGATVEDVVLSHIQVLTSYGDRLNWEIGVLDDGSTDQTPRVLQSLQHSFPNLQVWRNESPSGIANAFAQLARHASHDWIYITSGDGQFDHNCLKILLDHWIVHPTTTLGVRVNRYSTYTHFRSIISRFYRFLTRIAFGVDLVDPGSVKIIPRKFAIAELISKSTMRDAEQLLLSQKSLYPIEFVPIPFNPRTTGRASGAAINNITANLVDLVRLWQHYRTT
jgi:glycosyltransferase involved in cell wall biosynthesis